MVSVETFKALCIGMPEVQEVLHWGTPAFRTKKRIFATLWPQENPGNKALNRPSANFGFTPEEQDAFCKAAPDSFMPVEGGWGRQGWTTVNLHKVKKKMLESAIQSAWYSAAPPKLQERYRLDNGLE
ncbi:MmcQ/YjbR family DNA-binding protein [Chitinophaga alhagiae]|uniref:MmcQ/YjbR family DNA-binding protein n=1 Tax=Chitinophaga alhagiae TaxID=2203219 RepID=UPI000E5C3412|nr:MmcQ/YjbR family DNA-binding protein [Chitinophaga alhagiae]